MEIKNAKNIIKNEWDLKYLKDGRYMPFGSMCRAYSQLNQNKDIDINKFLSDMDKLAEKSLELIIQDINRISDLIEKELKPEYEKSMTVEESFKLNNQRSQQNYDQQKYDEISSKTGYF